MSEYYLNEILLSFQAQGIFSEGLGFHGLFGPCLKHTSLAFNI